MENKMSEKQQEKLLKILEKKIEKYDLKNIENEDKVHTIIKEILFALKVEIETIKGFTFKTDFNGDVEGWDYNNRMDAYTVDLKFKKLDDMFIYIELRADSNEINWNLEYKIGLV